MKTSSPAFLPQLWASCVQGVGEGQVPHLPKATFQLQPGKKAPEPGRGEGREDQSSQQSPKSISYQPGARKTPRQNEQKV